jgi:hypothetical protein
MGVGMPKALLLDEFGSKIWDAFGDCPYLVGSALTLKTGWRDVDVRLVLDDDIYEAMGFGKPNLDEHRNAKWIAFTLAFSALGRDMTGLPIDFQIQQQTAANKEFNGSRSAIGLVPHRYRDTYSDMSDHCNQPTLTDTAASMDTHSDTENHISKSMGPSEVEAIAGNSNRDK